MRLLLLVPLILFIAVHADGKSSLRRSAVVVAVEKVSPAVVNISTVVKERMSGPMFPFQGHEFFRDFFPDIFTREYTRTSLGSGVIIDGKKGHIVTNHHVVARAAEIKVITSSKGEYQAKILGSDPRSDLAILQVQPDKPLPQIEMGNSEDLMIGETVIAIGNPFGLSHTVTTGVVSALERTVRADEDQVYHHLIQTDASINPGNSGGPLLNIEGGFIGINSAIYQKAQGIGFAIPIQKVKRIARELIRAGEVRFPWLGLETQELTPDLKSHFRFPEKLGGVLVSDVMKDSPAALAGIRRGDILLKIGGIPLSTLSDYREALAEYTPSDLVTISVFRKGQNKGFKIRPDVFPPGLALDLVYQRIGIKLSELDRAAKRKYKLKGGLLITEIAKGSEAQKIGLEPGDLLMKVNQVPVKSLEDFKNAISRYHHLPSLTIIFQRGPYAYSLTLPF